MNVGKRGDYEQQLRRFRDIFEAMNRTPEKKRRRFHRYLAMFYEWSDNYGLALNHLHQYRAYVIDDFIPTNNKRNRKLHCDTLELIDQGVVELEKKNADTGPV